MDSKLMKTKNTMRIDEAVLTDLKVYTEGAGKAFPLPWFKVVVLGFPI